MDELTHQGIQALKAGDRARARHLLRSALEKAPDNLQAWMWLSGAVELDDEKLACLQQVMRIDPGNPTAARGIARLTGRDMADVLAESAAAVVAAATAPNPPVESAPPGEIIFKARPSLLSTLLLLGITPVLLFFALLAGLTQLSGETFFVPAIMLTIVAAVIFFIWRLISLLSTRYTITSNTIVIARGAFKRTRLTIPLRDVHQVVCQRNFLQRLAGTGNILILTDLERPEELLKLADVEKCVQRSKQIEEAISGFKIKLT